MISGIIPDLRKTDDLVQEISASSKEQTSGAGQINSALMQLDQVVQQNASASEEMASMAEELNGQADQLQTTVAFFRIDTQDRAVRALAAPAAHHRVVAARHPVPAVRHAVAGNGDDTDSEYESF